jgi:ABC-type Mn2+/Zn2+ transport system permease subunit
MSELLQALRDPALPFLRMALFAGALSSIAFGILGPIVTARRIVNIAVRFPIPFSRRRTGPVPVP